MNYLKLARRTFYPLLLLTLIFPGEGLAQEPQKSIPRRIISLAPSVTETLFALGAGGRLVGVTTYCDFPPEARKIPKIGSFVNPSIEAVLAKQPDLVIGVPEGTNQESVKRMERLGLRVLLVSVSSLNDILSSIRLIAATVAKEEAGKELVLRIQTRMEHVKKRIQGAQRRRVLLLVGLRPLVAVGKGTFIDELITLAGGENIAAAAPHPWPHLPVEYVVAKAPQVIIEGVMGSEREEPRKRWSDLKSIPAVKEDRIYFLPSDKILRPGPRVGVALEELGRLIHPECFDGSHGKRRKGAGCAGS
jgi:iron complex transport system substrate-binding protein